MRWRPRPPPRFTAGGTETLIEDGTTCCYALQDKVWVTLPGSDLLPLSGARDGGFEGVVLAPGL